MDFPVKNVAYGYIVKSTIASGTISDIERRLPKKPGVVGIVTHKNAIKLAPYDPMRGGPAFAGRERKFLRSAHRRRSR